MAMIFIFGFARKYLQEKKLGHFENPWTKIFRDHVFSNYHFPSQNLNKKSLLFSELVQIHVHEPQSGAQWASTSVFNHAGRKFHDRIWEF